MNRRRLVILLLAGGLTAACSPRADARGCPSVAELRNYRPPEASRVFAADGSVLADLSPQRRVVVALDEIPPLVRDGFVAVEDRRFWKHGGVDLRGVARALWRDITSLSLKEGFSTITMQLVRNVFPEELPRSEKLRRKACEVVLARRLEDEMQKPDILALYLNQIYLGSGLYGVEAAAQGYFGKPVSRLDTAEAALLIGLVKSPEGYNPRKHPLKAIGRRNVVLDVMAREGVITADAAGRAKETPLRLSPPAEAAGPAPYFVAAVRRELRDRFGPDADVRGLRVHTGLDPDLQRAAAEALDTHLRKVESGAYGRYRHAAMPGDDAPPAEDGGSPFLQGAVVVLDPATGLVRALVGGRDFAHSQFDRALQARRQPGSAFKPILYAAALEAGVPVTARLETGPILVDDAGAPPWEPSDHIPDSIAALSLRDAFALSSNTAAVRLGQRVGPERVAEMARRLGISTPVPAYPSTFLGAAEVVPAELTAAFAAFANGGYRVRPGLVERVEDAKGNVLWSRTPARERVIDEGVAFLTLSLMEEVVDRGTGAVVRRLGFWLPAAGKTGTTNGARDNWFVGMTPDLVAGVWVGFDRPASILPGASGSLLAAPVWAELMKAAYRDRPGPVAWTPPASVVSLPVDAATGALATANCPPEAIRIEHFLHGTEPLEHCPLHPEGAGERFFRRLWRGVRDIFEGETGPYQPRP